MDDIKISLDSSGRAGEITTVRVDGVIDTMTAGELEKVMTSLLEQKKYRIVVDLAGVDYISSAGWGIFISNIREIKAHEGDIKLARMVPSVYEIFELLEFDSILKAYDNIEKARSDFRLPHPPEAAQKVQAPQPAVKARELPDPPIQNNPGEVMTEEYHIQPESNVQTLTAEAPPQPSIEIPKPSSVEQELLGLVKADPFYSISEMVKIINSGSNGSREKVGWWKVWRMLRKNSLLSKKKRFRYSRRG